MVKQNGNLAGKLIGWLKCDQWEKGKIGKKADATGQKLRINFELYGFLGWGHFNFSSSGEK